LFLNWDGKKCEAARPEKDRAARIFASMNRNGAPRCNSNKSHAISRKSHQAQNINRVLQFGCDRGDYNTSEAISDHTPSAIENRPSAGW
jgi:hypothetical protein